MRTPSCVVEVTLGVATSDEAGPERWTFIGSRDFAEVRPSGATRQAKHLDPNCERALNLRFTALPPRRSHELAIAVGIDNASPRAMPRPDGTAGWVVDLPPLTPVPTTTGPSTTTPISPPTPAEATDAAEAEPPATTIETARRDHWAPPGTSCPGPRCERVTSARAQDAPVDCSA